MNETPISNPFDEDEKAGRRPVVWAMLGLVAMCCGVVFAGAIFWFKPDAQSLMDQYFPSPTATPTQTPTSTPTNTPSPTSTSTPTPNWTATMQAENAHATADSAVNGWKVVLADTFDSNENNWLIKEADDDEYAITTYKIEDGKYIWDATSHKSFIGWVRASLDPIDDFYASVDIKQSSGPDTADYGIVFREDDNSNFYYFGIDEKSEYVLYLYYEEWLTLIDWTETDLIRPGETNRLTVIGEGSHFIFFINDQYLVEITDDNIREGTAAIAIEVSEADTQATFEFDNFELRVP